MRIFGLVECRAITRSRVQLGDPSKDIYSYQVYSFMGHRDFDVQMYDFEDEARLVSRKDDILELGAQYLLSLTDEDEKGAALFCYKCVPHGSDYDIGLKAEDHGDTYWWTNVRLTIRSKVPVPVGKTYYLDFPNG